MIKIKYLVSVTPLGTYSSLILRDKYFMFLLVSTVDLINTVNSK